MLPINNPVVCYDKIVESVPYKLCVVLDEIRSDENHFESHFLLYFKVNESFLFKQYRIRLRVRLKLLNP